MRQGDVIEIKPDLGFRSSGVWGNPLEDDEDISASRLSTFQTYREYFDYLFWQSPNVLMDGVDAGMDVLKAGVEAQDLLFNPIYREKDLPRGDGSCVLIIPGFWGNRLTYYLPRENLRRLGWQAEIYPVKYGGHIEPTERMIDPFVKYCREKSRLSGKKIHVIGHSKGGHVALAAAILRSDELSQSVDQLVIGDSPIPERVNFQVGVGYLAMQTVLRGNDFQMTRLANDHEGLSRIENKFRLTTLKVAGGKIISGLHVGSEENIIEVNSTHSGLFHYRDNLRFVHMRLSRQHSSIQEEGAEKTHFPKTIAA